MIKTDGVNDGMGDVLNWVRHPAVVAVGLKKTCHVGEQLASYWTEEVGREKLERNDMRRQMMRVTQGMKEYAELLAPSCLSIFAQHSSHGIKLCGNNSRCSDSLSGSRICKYL